MKRPTFRQSLAGFFQLVRLPNLLIIILTQYLIRIFLVNHAANWKAYLVDYQQFILTSSTVFIAAGGYIINDYFDVKIDLINKPKAVIIGRLIRRRYAIILHQILNFFGIFLAIFLSWKIVLINILAYSCLWFYASRFKKVAFVGNFLVAMLTAASLISMAVFYDENDKMINIYALFAFSITLIREIIKDMEDIRGDARYGCRTLPIIWGLRRTKTLLYFFIFSFVILLFSMTYSLDNQRLMIIFACLIPLIIFMSIKLYRADKKRDFGYLSNLCKIIMLIGILSMIFV